MNTCQRAGKCPCKTAKRQCTVRCKCGTKRQPCKNKVSHQLPQQPSLVEQFSEVEVRKLLVEDVTVIIQCTQLLMHAGLCEWLE